MGTEKKFLTFQTVQRYEAALLRHSQYCRWVKVLMCPCINQSTNQPDVQCSICKGRGEIYQNPGPFKVIYEMVEHDNFGRAYLKNRLYVDGTVTLWKVVGDNQFYNYPLSLTQPVDKSYVQLEEPWPKAYTRLYANYEFDPTVSVVNENSEVVGTNLLRATTLRVAFKGQSYDGSISNVSRVYNVTKGLTYTVTLSQKSFIYLQSMPSYVVGDVLQVDYTYLPPFTFMLHSVSQRRRYETAYVVDQADATLVTAYYYDVGPGDLITALGMDIQAFTIINPLLKVGNDIINDYFDVSRLLSIVDKNGTIHNVKTEVQLYGRNEIKWLVAKPIVPYTAQFMVHPTFVGLTTYDTARFSENKQFVNRINVMLRDRMTKEVSF